MTRDEHIAEAEACLYRAMSRGTGEKAQYATAEATIGLLHVALAGAKPVVVIGAGEITAAAQAAYAALERMEAPSAG